MTQLFKNLYANVGTEFDYFSRLDTTFFTLFQLGTLDAWGNVTRQVIKTYGYGWIPIVAFVTISGFVIMNLVIAVICEAVSSMNDDGSVLNGWWRQARIHGDCDDDLDSSEETRPPVLREQIENFEDQMDELLQAQEKVLKKKQISDGSFPQEIESNKTQGCSSSEVHLRWFLCMLTSR